jgi:hypothetical protein
MMLLQREHYRKTVATTIARPPIRKDATAVSARPSNVRAAALPASSVGGHPFLVGLRLETQLRHTLVDWLDFVGLPARRRAVVAFEAQQVVLPVQHGGGFEDCRDADTLKNGGPFWIVSRQADQGEDVADVPVDAPPL